MKITFQTPPKNIDEKMISNILRDYKLLNCEVLIRDEDGMINNQYLHLLRFTCLWQIANFYPHAIATVDDLIDVIMKDHRKYIKWYARYFPT